jgi:hypothetical protein
MSRRRKLPRQGDQYRRRRRKRNWATSAMVLVGAAVLGTAVGHSGLPTGRRSSSTAIATGGANTRPKLSTISGCTVTDGDTIRCGKERIRLLGSMRLTILAIAAAGPIQGLAPFATSNSPAHRSAPW